MQCAKYQGITKQALLRSKRACFTLQKPPFYNAKPTLLHRKKVGSISYKP